MIVQKVKTEIKYHTIDIYYRLVGLWVLNEAMLGGIIHGFKLPVSGLVVGSGAVICICLIGWYVPDKKAIIKATIIVAVFKMILSPQAPLPAYFAVFFQGIMGQLLFFNRKYFKISCIVFSILALLESGLQRILVLTIIYGNDLWTVFNEFISRLMKSKSHTNFSLIAGIAYIIIHFVTGLIVGMWSSKLPGRIRKWSSDSSYILKHSDVPAIEVTHLRKGRRAKLLLFVIWLILIGLYVQSYFKLGEPILPSHISMKILLRSAIIVIGWMILVAPLLKNLLHKWLSKRQTASATEVTAILQLLPTIQQVAIESWRGASGNNIKKLMEFTRLLLVNTLHKRDLELPHIFILSKPVHSGKTSSIVEWASDKNNVFGIITPVIDGKRMFMDAYSKNKFDMEATGSDEETLEIGRFIFSKNAFDKASGIITSAIDEPGWVIVDEVGPLELKQQGFHQALIKLLESRNGKILLVIREKQDFLNRVISFFQIENAVIVNDISALPR